MDVTGIVALVLAAGGAAYLIRARIVSGRGEASAEQKSAARDEKTMPPVLRPPSDRPPAKKTTPATPDAKAKTDDAPMPSRLKMTLVADTPETKAEDKGPDKAEKKGDKAEKKAEKKADKKADKADKGKESKPSTAAATPAEVKITPAAETDPKITPTPVTVPERKAFNKRSTIVGVAPPPTPSAPPPAVIESAPPKAPEPALPVIDVPRLDTDEDEDVEPTRVGRYERQSIRPPIEKHVFDNGADEAAKPGPPLALAVFALAQTDPGKRRKHNEDNFLIRDQDGVYVVADGMGGHRGGEFASKIAVETIDKAFEDKRFEAEAHADLATSASELARAIQMANAAILAEAGRKPELKGMGTTLCAARFTDGNHRLFLGHVGDSRCYRVRGGVMKQMTTDHTMADYGVTGPEGAHLSRALGVWPTVPIDVIMASPELNDVYLLCSDGLTKMLTNETIQTQLLHEEDPKAAVDRLVFFANAHGGKDNITVVLLRVVEPGWKPPSTRGTPDSA